MSTRRAILIWGMTALIAVVPLIVAAQSPLLAWRSPVYIAAGFAGIVGFSLIFAQPLLAGGLLPGLPMALGRRIHRWIGVCLIVAVIGHVGGLWLTSPPDVVDALLFRSPTPFSAWGVIAMWAIFAAGLIAAFRRRLSIRLPVWRLLHTGLAAVVVTGTVGHAWLVQGAMGTISKGVLCLSALAVFAKVIAERRVWTSLSSR